jgi:hypothetical protein
VSRPALVPGSPPAHNLAAAATTGHVAVPLSPLLQGSTGSVHAITYEAEDFGDAPRRGGSARRAALAGLLLSAAAVAAWWMLTSHAGDSITTTGSAALTPGDPLGGDSEPAILRTQDLPTIVDEEEAVDEIEPPQADDDASGGPTAPATVQARHGPRVKPRSRGKPTSKKNPCTPPYYFDKQGIKRLKMTCL